MGYSTTLEVGVLRMFVWHGCSRLSATQRYASIAPLAGVLDGTTRCQLRAVLGGRVELKCIFRFIAYPNEEYIRKTLYAAKSKTGARMIFFGAIRD